MWSRFIDWAVNSEGSSRSAALIRIGLVLLIWSRWAQEVAPHYNPHPLRPLLAVAFATSTGFMLVGLWTRIAVPTVAVVTGLMYGYGIVSPETSGWRAHHTYLLVAAVVYCALTQCGRSYSVDRWLEVGRSRKLGIAPLPERSNLLGLRLITLQLSVVYFFAAIDKTHWGFLNGSRVEAMLMRFYSGSVFPEWPGFHEVCVILGVLTVVLEYSLAVGLFFPRARRVLLPLGILFHAGLYFAVPVMTFTMTTILLYLAYFDPDDVHRVIDELQEPSTSPTE